MRDGELQGAISQTHEGWELVNEQYDDGGWSGGNMDRTTHRFPADTHGIVADQVDTLG